MAQLYGSDQAALFPSAADLSAGFANTSKLSAMAGVMFVNNGTLYVPAKGDATSGLYVQNKDSGGSNVFPAVATPANGIAYGSLSKIMAVVMLDNGTTLDLDKAHWDNITLLASAARTGTTTTAVQTNVGHRGAIAWLNITAASGTGGLQLRWVGKDPVSGNTGFMNANPTAVTSISSSFYVIYPSSYANSNATQAVSYPPIPRTWFIQVTHGDSSSYTYSVTLSLLR